MDRADFIELLALDLKYALYSQFHHDFKNKEVNRVEVRVRNEEPVLHVTYELKMERTDLSIADENPVEKEKRINFGYYEGTITPEWSTIQGIILFKVQYLLKDTKFECFSKPLTSELRRSENDKRSESTSFCDSKICPSIDLSRIRFAKVYPARELSFF